MDLFFVGLPFHSNKISWVKCVVALFFPCFFFGLFWNNCTQVCLVVIKKMMAHFFCCSFFSLSFFFTLWQSLLAFILHCISFPWQSKFPINFPLWFCSQNSRIVVFGGIMPLSPGVGVGVYHFGEGFPLSPNKCLLGSKNVLPPKKWVPESPPLPTQLAQGWYLFL